VDFDASERNDRTLVVALVAAVTSSK
jgi:hypothetical protein